MATHKRKRTATPDRIVNTWEQQKGDLRAVLVELGYDGTGEKLPDGGEATADDPHVWFAYDSTRKLASFYTLNGQLTLLDHPHTLKRVAAAYAALRAQKEGLH